MTMAKWTTEDGKVLPVKTMKTSHVQNCIKFLERKGFMSAVDWAIDFN